MHDRPQASLRERCFRRAVLGLAMRPPACAAGLRGGPQRRSNQASSASPAPATTSARPARKRDEVAVSEFGIAIPSRTP